MKMAISIILLILSFLGLIFLGMDIDERYKKSPIIPHTLLAYMFGAAVVCGIVIGVSCAIILINL